MLSPEKNAMLTRVGPNTPMGDLMRRYWQPMRRWATHRTRSNAD